MSNEDICGIVATAMVTLYISHVKITLCSIQMYLATQGYHLSFEAINQAMHEIFRPLTLHEQARIAASVASLGKWLVSLH